MVPSTRTGEPRGARGPQAGFTLAALIIILAVMAIFLTVAVETATFQKRRENEAELIFRGNQIVEAIRLFRAHNGRYPISLEELVKAKPHVLRKVWKDPITGKADWVPVFLGQGGRTIGGGGRVGPGGQFIPATDRGGLFGATGPGEQGEGQPSTEAKGPIIGVHSRSCADSIKVVDGRTRYCDWKFVFDPKKLGGGGTTTEGGTPGGGTPGGGTTTPTPSPGTTEPPESSRPPGY